MPVALYMDHNVNRAVVQGLRLRGVDLVTAHEDGTHELDDAPLLDRASNLRRVLFSTDVDLVVEARKRQASGTPFAGVIFARQDRVPIGVQIDDLELIAKAAEPEELEGTLLYLPLRATS